jgi:hypothetical protein
MKFKIEIEGQNPEKRANDLDWKANIEVDGKAAKTHLLHTANLPAEIASMLLKILQDEGDRK